MPELWFGLGELLFPPKRTDLAARLRGATLACARCGNEYRSDKRNGSATSASISCWRKSAPELSESWRIDNE